MTTEYLKREEFLKKIINHVIELVNDSNFDEMIYGVSYWEFTDNKIELLDPKKVILTNKKGKSKPKNIIISGRTTIKEKLYGKSILENHFNQLNKNKKTK